MLILDEVVAVAKIVFICYRDGRTDPYFSEKIKLLTARLTPSNNSVPQINYPAASSGVLRAQTEKPFRGKPRGIYPQALNY